MQAKIVYIPVDISDDALDLARQDLQRLFPDVRTEPLLVDYVASPLQLELFNGPTLLLYLGSSIGNFSPKEARTILRNFSRQLQPADALLLGTDLLKDVSMLVAAYDDRERVTAAFNLNVLRRLNRELEADFDLEGFAHRVFWNGDESRIEMHLESLRDQTASVPGANLEVPFRKHETIHTENSYKFTDGSIESLLRDSSFLRECTWKDECGRYALSLARPTAFEV